MTVLAGLLVVLARDPEHTRCDADVVGDLELIPGFQSDRHAAVGTPATVVAVDRWHTTDGEASLVALDEDILEVQADHPAAGLGRVASIDHVNTEDVAVVAGVHRSTAVSAGDLELLAPLVGQGEAVLIDSIRVL